MPKKDGTATKAEVRQAEMYDRLAKLSDHAAAQSRRFRALGFEVDCFVGELKLKPEVVDEILDRLESGEHW